MRLTNQPKEKKGIRVKSDTTKLKNENILKTFRLQSLCIPQGEGGGTFWGDLKVFGKGQGGFTKILDRRRVKNNLRAKYTETDREVKGSIKADKRKWTQNIADEAEEAAKNQQIKTLYVLTKMLCNERSRQS